VNEFRHLYTLIIKLFNAYSINSNYHEKQMNN